MIANKFGRNITPWQPLSLNSAPVERSYTADVPSQALAELPTSPGPETAQPGTIGTIYSAVAQAMADKIDREIMASIPKRKGGWPKGKPRGNR